MTKQHIIRIFRATAKADKVAAFRKFFLSEALPLLRSIPGVVSVQVGVPMSDEERTFTMITTWSSMESLQGFAGERWEEAVIDPREAPLLEHTELHHFFEAEQ